MKLSIVMPVYNEAETVLEVVERVRSVDFGTEVELLIVDDGSTDGTQELLRTIDGGPGIKVAFHPKNRGKGAALRTAFAAATGDVVAIQDADFEYDPRELVDVVRPIWDDVADVVFGSRFKGGRISRVLYFWHRLGNLSLTLLSNMLTDLNLTDIETCYKAFRREVLERVVIEEDRFGFEPEITAKVAALRPRLRIYEVGISYQGRTYEEGKKIGWRDGFRAVWCILRYNLLRRRG
jgi:glycosyltransferase involved in cell wall biosynthesis